MTKTITRPPKRKGLTVKVVGLSFQPGYPATVLDQYPDFPDGDPHLVRESTNKYDENAVAVYHFSNQLGHLPKELAATIGPEMDQGISWKVKSAFVKVHFGDLSRPGIELVLIRDSSAVN